MSSRHTIVYFILIRYLIAFSVILRDAAPCPVAKATKQLTAKGVVLCFKKTVNVLDFRI